MLHPPEGACNRRRNIYWPLFLMFSRSWQKWQRSTGTHVHGRSWGSAWDMQENFLAWNSLGKTSAKGEILGPVQSNHGYFRFIRNNNRPIA